MSYDIVAVYLLNIIYIISLIKYGKPSMQKRPPQILPQLPSQRISSQQFIAKPFPPLSAMPGHSTHAFLYAAYYDK